MPLKWEYISSKFIPKQISKSRNNAIPYVKQSSIPIICLITFAHKIHGLVQRTGDTAVLH